MSIIGIVEVSKKSFSKVFIEDSKVLLETVFSVIVLEDFSNSIVEVSLI